jgi:hypothetical protein
MGLDCLGSLLAQPVRAFFLVYVSVVAFLSTSITNSRKCKRRCAAFTRQCHNRSSGNGRTFKAEASVSFDPVFLAFSAIFAIDVIVSNDTLLVNTTYDTLTTFVTYATSMLEVVIGCGYCLGRGRNPG